MSRRDPGAADSGAVREPGRCHCGHLEGVHKPRRIGQPRGGCSTSTCNCTHYEEA